MLFLEDRKGFTIEISVVGQLLDLSCILLIQIHLAPIGCKALKAKVMFDRVTVAVVDSDRLLEDLK